MFHRAVFLLGFSRGAFFSFWNPPAFLGSWPLPHITLTSTSIHLPTVSDPSSAPSCKDPYNLGPTSTISDNHITRVPLPWDIFRSQGAGCRYLWCLPHGIEGFPFCSWLFESFFKNVNIVLDFVYCFFCTYCSEYVVLKVLVC